jgi:mannose-6-phosphate isomerase-like protein (cupin superfamily)
MARQGQIIRNNVAKFDLQWIQTMHDTNGAFVACTMLLAPGAFMPVRHIHPRQTERFEVRAGHLRVECDGDTTVLGPGEAFTVEQGKPHQWWNASEEEPTDMLVTMTPSYNWETQMEQIFGIMNAKGKLSFLQIMALANEYEMYIAGPPLFLQKALSTLLYPVARIAGLKKFYPEYSA